MPAIAERTVTRKTYVRTVPSQAKSVATDFSKLDDEQFIRKQTVVEILNISIPTLYRWMANGDFPRPVKFGRRMSAWKVRTIREYIAKREAQQAA